LAVADNLIKNGTFDKGADGWVNQPQTQLGVNSEWSTTAGRSKTAGVHIESEKGGDQAIWIWRYIITDLPVGKALRVRGWVRGKSVQSLAAICVQGWDADHKNMVDFATTQMSKPLTGDFDWTEIQTDLAVSAQTRQAHILIFIAGVGEVWFDDISAEPIDAAIAVSQPTAGQSKPGLFEVRGAYKVTATAQSPKPTFLLPMPLAYREQVPLTYELSSEPPGKLTSVRVYADRPGNYVAEVVLSPMNSGDTLGFEWTSVVLVGPRSFEDLPKYAPLPKDWPAESRPWLKSTRCVQADHERIQKVAEEIRADSNDVMQIIGKTLEQTKSIYSDQKDRCTELDAVSALDKQGSCTSSANLVAALLRANHIPARILAGYPAWSGPLQTHYIVEAYVPDYGWYPIESTMLQAPWPPSQQIEVSIIPPEYEDRSQPRNSAAGGVPYLSLTENPGFDNSFIALGAADASRNCDHVAKSLRPFPEDSPATEWELAIDRAKARWTAWLESSPVLDSGHRLTTLLQANSIKGDSPATLAKMLK